MSVILSNTIESRILPRVGWRNTAICAAELLISPGNAYTLRNASLASFPGKAMNLRPDSFCNSFQLPGYCTLNEVAGSVYDFNDPSG